MSRLGGDGIHADSHARCVAVHSLPCAAVLLLLLSVLTMTSARHALQSSKSKSLPVESFMQMLTCHRLARAAGWGGVASRPLTVLLRVCGGVFCLFSEARSRT